jgi:predicted site-specific integrase-resolvase
MVEARNGPKKGKTLSLTEAADEIGVHRTTLHRWKEEGLVKVVYFGKSPKVEAAEVERLKRLHASPLGVSHAND